MAGQGSVGWEGVEGRREEGGGGGGWWWLSFEEAINCKAQGTVKRKKKKDLTQNEHCEKKSLNQIFSLSLSLSITLSPCALLNSIKESSSAGRRWVMEAGGLREKQGRKGRKGEDGEGKDFNI